MIDIGKAINDHYVMIKYDGKSYPAEVLAVSCDHVEAGPNYTRDVLGSRPRRSIFKRRITVTFLEV